MEIVRYFFGNLWHFGELVVVLVILAYAIRGCR